LSTQSYFYNENQTFLTAEFAENAEKRPKKFFKHKATKKPQKAQGNS